MLHEHAHSATDVNAIGCAHGTAHRVAYSSPNSAADSDAERGAYLTTKRFADGHAERDSHGSSNAFADEHADIVAKFELIEHARGEEGFMGQPLSSARGVGFGQELRELCKLLVCPRCARAGATRGRRAPRG